MQSRTPEHKTRLFVAAVWHGLAAILILLGLSLSEDARLFNQTRDQQLPIIALTLGYIVTALIVLLRQSRRGTPGVVDLVVFPVQVERSPAPLNDLFGVASLLKNTN